MFNRSTLLLYHINVGGAPRAIRYVSQSGHTNAESNCGKRFNMKTRQMRLAVSIEAASPNPHGSSSWGPCQEKLCDIIIWNPGFQHTVYAARLSALLTPHHGIVIRLCLNNSHSVLTTPSHLFSFKGATSRVECISMLGH